MAGLRPLLISTLLTGLFVIALLTAGIRYAQVNGASHSIADDPSIAIYANSLNQTLSGALSNTQSAQTALGQSPTTLSTVGIVFDAVASVWKTLISVPVALLNLTFQFIAVHIFGSESFAIVLTVILSIITLTIVFFVVKWATTGEGG